MAVDDPNSKTHLNNGDEYVWNSGVEIWCNLQGRYTHIVADLAHMATPYTMGLCNLGIMGARYGRTGFSLPTSIEIQSGKSSQLVVPHIVSLVSIGTQLDINLRQATGDELSFVTFTEQSGETLIAIDTLNIPVGVYVLKLESFSTLQLKSTLKSEEISIIVSGCSLD